MIIIQDFPSRMRAIFEYDDIKGERKRFQLNDEYGKIIVCETPDRNC